MNNILDNGYNYCTGCAACAIICPENAITINLNVDGFLAPVVDKNKCIECGICKKVCYKYLEPVKITAQSDYHNKQVLAVLNNYHEQLHTVSTIGIATALSKYYFEKNYNVCGVTFSDTFKLCKHKIAETTEDLTQFKGSKYLQSANYEAFKLAFESNKKTIVFGTPCQIYGLRKIIQLLNIEAKFILVDLFCVGVPTYNLWFKYLDFLQRNFHINPIHDINFRDKTQGWHKFSIMINKNSAWEYRQNIFNDMFFDFYLNKTCNNLACYDCKLRHDVICSDIRLGDFWGEKYNKFDDGIGLVILLTDNGKKAWNNIKHRFRYKEETTEAIFHSQKFNKIEIPNNYFSIFKELKLKNKKLEDIHSKFKINNKTYK